MKDNRFQNAGIGKYQGKNLSTQTKRVPFVSTLMLISSQLPSLSPPLQSSCILINLPRIPRRISHLSAYWQLKWKNRTTLKVSNNQRTKHFQPDYDVFVDVASCWYCFSSAFFFTVWVRQGGWEFLGPTRVPSTQGHVLRLSEGRRQQREGREDLEDAGAVGPLRLVRDNGLEEPDEVLGAGTPRGPALANGSEVWLGLVVEVSG